MLRRWCSSQRRRGISSIALDWSGCSSLPNFARKDSRGWPRLLRFARKDSMVVVVEASPPLSLRGTKCRGNLGGVVVRALFPLASHPPGLLRRWRSSQRQERNLHSRIKVKLLPIGLLAIACYNTPRMSPVRILADARLDEVSQPGFISLGCDHQKRKKWR